MRDGRLHNETLNPALKGTIALLELPRFVKSIMAYFKRAADPFYAHLLEMMYPKSIVEERALVAHRDELRAGWHESWTEANLDFIITVPHPLPALQNGTSERASLMSTGYTFLFNMLDYTAGVLPVTCVDKKTDALPSDFLASDKFKSMNAIAKGVYSVYDAEKMHGLPLVVQIAGRRMEEEKVLEGMKIVEAALRAAGTLFVPKVLV
ncbi:amidase signature domain-containing protein [Mycena rebaudengoi]|nr:amidase signature domain-containing protein [Mycena rebaudengoi]